MLITTYTTITMYLLKTIIIQVTYVVITNCEIINIICTYYKQKN